MDKIENKGRSWDSFYTGLGYPTVDEIITEAKANGFTHYYWASEIGYHGFYNGDTVVVYNRVEDLPESYQKDAIRYGKEI